MGSWRPAPEPSDDDPRRLRDSLDRVARQLGAPGADTLATVFVHWEEAVGASVAAHAQPVSLARGTLVVAAEDPAWATQLRYLTADILRRLGELVGGPVAERVEVRVARPGTPPRRPSAGAL
jgi:predicted nucleic acid-binding Zn ribbon protein